MASTSVRVALRIRPLTAKELLEDASECMSLVDGNANQVIIGTERRSLLNQKSNQQSFTFDNVFEPSVGQQQVYECCSKPLVDSFLLGFNATILAYGQTGSGKTYTMGTGLEFINDEETQGVVPRAIEDIFSSLSQRTIDNPNGFKYSLHITFIELYNEELLDLLNPRPRTANNSCSLTIREDVKGNIIWGGIREQAVDNSDEVLGYLQKGSLCRTTGSTDMNAQSSRSHAIFSIILKQQKWIVPSTETNATGDINPFTFPGGSWHKITSKFHFVDLAGSERLKRTNAQGDRKQEGISINEGLFVLGKVISALGDESKKSIHVPYRDSKLTRLLQDSLGGNSQTLMLACVSPSTTNFGESLNTLQYANRAKNIKNKVIINEEWSTIVNEQELKHLRATVSKLQSEIAIIRSGGELEGVDINQLRLSSAKAQKYERQLQQAHTLQQNLQEELDLIKDENSKLLFEKEKITYKCYRLRHRVDFLSQDLESKIAERFGIDSEESRAYSAELLALKQKLNDSEDKLCWFNDAISRIATGQKLPDSMRPEESDNEEENDFIHQQMTTEDTDVIMNDTSLKSKRITPEKIGIEDLLFQIQCDVQKYKTLSEALKNRENEYEGMKQAYDQKLNVLQDQLLQVKKERDLALSRLKPDGSNTSMKEKSGSVNMKLKADKENKRLESEIMELRKKLTARANTRIRSDQLTRTLKNSIQTLKSEKNLLTKKLKDESGKNREMLDAKIRELAKLKKKQEKANETSRRNIFQPRKKGPEYSGLKRSSSMNSAGFEDEDEKRNKPRIRSSRTERSDAVPVETRARKKKELLEQYIHICQVSKQIDFQIQQLDNDKQSLIQEQSELIAEREKCVTMDVQQTGEFDANKPQYMDDRLAIIDNEIMVIEEKIYGLSIYCTSYAEDGTFLQNYDQGWQDVLMVLDGLEYDEIRALTEMIIAELIDLRAIMHDSQMQISEKETMIYELRASLDLMRNAAIEASMDYEKKQNEAFKYNSKIIDYVAACYESGSFPSSLSGFMNDINVPDSVHSVYSSQGSFSIPEQIREDKESSQSYYKLSKNMSLQMNGDQKYSSPANISTTIPNISPKNKSEDSRKDSAVLEKPKEIFTTDLTSHLRLPPIKSIDSTKDVASKLSNTRLDRAAKLEWKQLDFLSGMKFDEPKPLRKESLVENETNKDVEMQFQSTKTSLQRLPNIKEFDYGFDNDGFTAKEPINKQVKQLIENSREDQDSVERRKSFDKILNIGKNALNWARGRSKQSSRSNSVSFQPQESDQTVYQSEDYFVGSKDNYDYEGESVDDTKRMRSYSDDVLMEDADMLSNHLRKSKSLAQNMVGSGGADVFSRLAGAHTKASEFKKKQKFLNNF